VLFSLVIPLSVVSPLDVVRCAGEDKVFILHTADGTTNEPLLTRTTVMGNPNRERFPKDDKLHCLARSVWDMHFYKGRIYIGSGDWGDNQGPIDIWSFGPSEDAKTRITFTKEFTVDGESVERFRSYAGRLLVPDIDPKESWEFGNLYIKENGGWFKRRTIPNSIHVFDVAYFDGKLYVTTGTKQGAGLYESNNWGVTWTRYIADEVAFYDERYFEMAILGDMLLVTTVSAKHICRFKDGKLERLAISLFPGETMRWLLPYRLTPFAGGILYTFRGPGENTPKPLFFLNDLEQGALVVQQFQRERVQDIIVRSAVCYVLTSRSSDNGYDNAVYQSADMKKWTLIAKFNTKAIAYSLERMDGVFYVGLASPDDHPYSESGSICRLE